MRTVVWGAPCSGKTTYVKEHMAVGDVVCDFDSIYEAISGLNKHNRTERLKEVVWDLVKALYEIIEKHPENDAWIITATKNKARVESLVKRMDADLVVLKTSREEAHKRCEGANRPKEWHDYIDQWFDAQMGENVFDDIKKTRLTDGNLIDGLWERANREIFDVNKKSR